MTNPETVYVGKREHCITELGGLTDIYPGKYLVCPIGNGNWDCEGTDTKKQLKEMIAYYRECYPEIIVCYV
jgi:hypothetical protein